jgi:UDP-glucose-4-epimerase GalE
MPVVLDNLSTGHRSFVRWGPLIQADIRDEGAVLHALLSSKAEAILHFAALALVGESMSDPQTYYSNNVAGSVSLFGAALQANCRKIVFSSSCSVYGEPEVLPIGETAPLHPVNPYGASKQMVERILSDYQRAHAFKSISLRYFNASGADPDAELGELRKHESHLIPRAMMTIQGHVHDFAIFGSDYDTPDGTAIRDYVHVSDLAEAHVIAVQQLLADGPSGTFNLGTGKGYSVRQVLDAIALETGKCVPAVTLPRRSGDPPTLFADATLSRKELGFIPAMSDLKKIVQTAWAWHKRAHPKLLRSTAAVSRPR